MKEFLVLLDTDKIKKYIYSAGTLKSIRGASSILAELNDRKAIEERVKAYAGRCVYAGGGQVMAVFNSDKQADKFMRAEQEEYKKYYASITVIKKEYIDGFDAVVKKAQIKLRRAKEEEAYKTQLLSNPFFKTCQLCGIDSASKLVREELKLKLICTACEMKINRGKEIRKNPKKSPIYAKFLEFLREQHTCQEWEKASFTKDLSELGKFSKPENFLGIIYADGNRMGERFLKLTEETEYEELSKNIEKGLEKSVYEALRKYIPNPSKEKIPFEFVVLGGDDLILLVPAQKVIPITIEILKKFEEKTRKFAEQIGEEKFTLSAGVVIAHPKFPILSLVKLAEDLLKSAKELNKEKWYGAENDSQKKEISTIDYSVITTPSVNPVKAFREKNLTYTRGGYTHKLTQRPLTLEKANKIVGVVKEIKKSKLSRSRLYAIYDSLWKGKNQSILNTISLITRLKGEKKENIKKLFGEIKNESLFYPDGSIFFPWNGLEGFEYDTPLLDILEIYDFIEENH